LVDITHNSDVEAALFNYWCPALFNYWWPYNSSSKFVVMQN